MNRKQYDAQNQFNANKNKIHRIFDSFAENLNPTK